MQDYMCPALNLNCCFARVKDFHAIWMPGRLVDYKIYKSLLVSCVAYDAWDASHVCGGCTFSKLRLCDACDGCTSPGVCVCNDMDVNYCVYKIRLFERDSRGRICDTWSLCVWRRILDAFSVGRWEWKPTPCPRRLRRWVLKGIGSGSGKRSAKVLNRSRAA